MKRVLTHSINSGWVRQFPAERVRRINQIMHAARGGKLLVSDDNRQAEFVDTNFYYRENGVDPDKAEKHNDILAIQAGIGSRMAVTLPEQVEIAKDRNIPYVTWLILDPDDNKAIPDQVESWFDFPGVSESPMFIDLEKPRSITRHINKSELKSGVETIRSLSPFRPGCYSRVNIFETVFPNGFDDWFDSVIQWIAQYLLDSNWSQYNYYSPFLETWSWSLPPAVVGSFLYHLEKWRKLVEMWQISDRGDAEHYIAPEWISPGQPGIKGCDLNVSMRPVNEFIDVLFSESNQPPVTPPPDEHICTFDFVSTRSVNFRTSPVVTSSTYAGTFPAGKVVKSELLENPTYGDFWLKFEMNGGVYYSALIYNGAQFYKPISE